MRRVESDRTQYIDNTLLYYAYVYFVLYKCVYYTQYFTLYIRYCIYDRTKFFSIHGNVTIVLLLLFTLVVDTQFIHINILNLTMADLTELLNLAFASCVNCSVQPCYIELLTVCLVTVLFGDNSLGNIS